MTQDAALKAAQEIAHDIYDRRRGLKQAWKLIDCEIQEEIIETWASIILNILGEQR